MLKWLISWGIATFLTVIWALLYPEQGAFAYMQFYMIAMSTARLGLLEENT